MAGRLGGVRRLQARPSASAVTDSGAVPRPAMTFLLASMTTQSPGREMHGTPSAAVPRTCPQRRAPGDYPAACARDPGVPGGDLRGVAGHRRPGECPDALP